ncbi:putative defensin, plant [Lupinus albus]|uniref:Putative defensin, plant n=1 Tax=Lupinus albus TaxID=3870 RepID=A0A6A4PNF2_LUPAL|nr:putative defensin, plant [Lupinus albus]
MMPRMVAEARKCKSESQKFLGICQSNTNCASICQSEGFPTGKCHGVVLFKKCLCKKSCLD